jgi:hypothetical protein
VTLFIFLFHYLISATLPSNPPSRFLHTSFIKIDSDMSGAAAKPKSAVFLTCGYTRTGKDTLFKSVAERCCCCGSPPDAAVDSCECCGSPPETNVWKIYSATTDSKPPTWLIDDSVACRRVAFADALKHVAIKDFKLPGTFIDYEHVKDTMILPGTSTTLRQHYINVGASKRALNPDYWCEAALGHLLYRENSADELLFVTDFRFTNELEYTKKHAGSVQTARLFRSDVPVPPAGVESEHQLDGLLTDFLLVPSKEDFDAAVKLFPQYKEFTARWSIAAGK